MILNGLFGVAFVIGTDRDELRACSLNLRIVLLQLTELRSAERSPAAAVKYKDDISISSIIIKGVRFTVAVW